MLSILVGLQSRLISLQSRLVDVAGREEGQGLTEYALILFLVAIAAIVALKLLGGNVNSVLNSTATQV